MDVIYEDNHIIAVNKTCREIVQGDKTGDKPLSEIVKEWLKEKYNKPGNVFISKGFVPYFFCEKFCVKFYLFNTAFFNMLRVWINVC